MTTEDILKTDYSKAFDDKRKVLICQSYYKYGNAVWIKEDENGNSMLNENKTEIMTEGIRINC